MIKHRGVLYCWPILARPPAESMSRQRVFSNLVLPGELLLLIKACSERQLQSIACQKCRLKSLFARQCHTRVTGDMCRDDAADQTDMMLPRSRADLWQALRPS